jgi:hypothetical protein
MRGWSIPLGRWMGVECACTPFFRCWRLCAWASVRRIGIWARIRPVLVACCGRDGPRDGAPDGGRLARPAPARRAAAAHRRTVCLRRSGEPGECRPGKHAQFALAFTGPLANLATALVLAATFLGAGGGMHLLDSALITAATCCAAWCGCRSAWRSCTLCPPIRSTAAATPRQLCAQAWLRAHRPRGHRPGPVLALMAMVGGMLLHNYWLIIAGFFIMIGAQIEDQGVFFQTVVDTVRMREVMLTDFRHPLARRTRWPTRWCAAFILCRRTSPSSAVRNWSASSPASALSTPCATTATAMCSRSCPAPSRWRARGHAGHHHSPPHGRPRPGPDSRRRERARSGHCERAEPDEFHVSAGRAAPHRARGKGRLSADRPLDGNRAPPEMAPIRSMASRHSKSRLPPAFILSPRPSATSATLRCARSTF